MDYTLNALWGDYILIINDDVEFYDHCIEMMLELSLKKRNSVIVGTTCDQNGKLTYGAIKYIKGICYKTLEISSNERADTFNANCVLIPYLAFQKTGSIRSELHPFTRGF